MVTLKQSVAASGEGQVWLATGVTVVLRAPLAKPYFAATVRASLHQSPVAVHDVLTPFTLPALAAAITALSAAFCACRCTSHQLVASVPIAIAPMSGTSAMTIIGLIAPRRSRQKRISLLANPWRRSRARMSECPRSPLGWAMIPAPARAGKSDRSRREPPAGLEISSAFPLLSRQRATMGRLRPTPPLERLGWTRFALL